MLPLQFPTGASRESLGLTGEEVYSITGLAAPTPPHRSRARSPSAPNGTGRTPKFIATVRIDTPAEAAYYRHGGILQYVLRQMLAGAD